MEKREMKHLRTFLAENIVFIATLPESVRFCPA